MEGHWEGGSAQRKFRAYVRPDRAIQVLRVYGSKTAVSHARIEIEEQMKALAGLDFHMAIKDPFIGFFISQGTKILSDMLGEYNVWLHTAPKPYFVSVQGGHDAEHVLRQLMNEPVNPLTNVRMNLKALGGTRQMRTFHGPHCICDLGVTDASLCDWPSCRICSIIKSCFTTFEFGATSNPGRFGNGIYTYFDPSRADRFTTSPLSTSHRAILLCEVNLPTKSSNTSKSPLVAKPVST